ncbi:hypothetical protein ACRRTK_004553 [Alexandromys fortis]
MSPRRRDVFCEDTHRSLANGEQASAPGPKAGAINVPGRSDRSQSSGDSATILPSTTLHPTDAALSPAGTATDG